MGRGNTSDEFQIHTSRTRIHAATHRTRKHALGGLRRTATQRELPTWPVYRCARARPSSRALLLPRLYLPLPSPISSPFGACPRCAQSCAQHAALAWQPISRWLGRRVLGAPRRARIRVVRVARAVSRRGRCLRPGRPLPLRGRDGAVGGAGALAWRFACVRGSGANGA